MLTAVGMKSERHPEEHRLRREMAGQPGAFGFAFIRGGEITAAPFRLVPGPPQNFSTHGRNSTSHVQALRCWFATYQ